VKRFPIRIRFGRLPARTSFGPGPGGRLVSGALALGGVQAVALALAKTPRRALGQALALPAVLAVVPLASKLQRCPLR
jgi:hypothetical protein